MDISAFLVGLAVFAILACILYPREIRRGIEFGLAKLFDESDEEFEQQAGKGSLSEKELSVLASTLVMFGSSECPHCAAAKEAIIEIAGEASVENNTVRFFELTGDTTAVANKFEIKHIPAFIWFDGEGKPNRMEGGGYDTLKAFYDEVVVGKVGNVSAPAPVTDVAGRDGEVQATAEAGRDGEVEVEEEEEEEGEQEQEELPPLSEV